MADLDQCRIAIAALASRLGVPGENRAEGLDRTVSARILDLGVMFQGHLHDGVLDDMVIGDEGPSAAIRLELASDDLLQLAGGELSIGLGSVRQNS